MENKMSLRIPNSFGQTAVFDTLGMKTSLYPGFLYWKHSPADGKAEEDKSKHEFLKARKGQIVHQILEQTELQCL